MEYKKVKLSECCKSISDGDHLPPPKSQSGVPFITISNIDGDNQIDFNDTMFVPDSYYDSLSEEKKARIGDILYSVVGSFGKPVFIDYDKRFVFQRHIAILKPNDEVNSRYLYYVMLNPDFYYIADKIAIGAAQRTITLNSLRNMTVNLPDIAMQNAIVDVLSCIDKKIQCNKKINDNLQQQLKLIYDYWFTQFDFPDENGKPYRSSGGAMVWNEQLKRKIPIDWQVISICNNDLCYIIKPGINSFSGHKTYLATADIVGTTIFKGNDIDYETRESRANMQPSELSVWFAKMKNSIKHLNLNREMKSIIEDSILSTGFCGLQCNLLSFEYIATFIEHSYFETIKDTLAHGATQEAINNDDLCNITLLKPLERVLTLYHEKTKDIYAQISNNICENQKLTQLRDWLLPMLMNGQATISD